MSQVVERFATTADRVHLIRGLLAYRNALYRAGIIQGFQWIDGSFVEHVEILTRRGKEPRPYDIDVVTFFYPPADGRMIPDELFETEETSERYSIDAYGTSLGQPLDQNLVNYISYWHGLWSLRKLDNQPKGFVQIDLDREDDAHARDALDARSP